MKINCILCLSLYMFCSLTLSAQTEKGSVLIGAQAKTALVEEFGISPKTQLAVFLGDGFAMGGGFDVSYLEEVFILGLQPTVRFYFSNSGKVLPFLQANVSWTSVDFDYSIWGYGAGAGIDILLSKVVALEWDLAYDRFEGTGILGISFGITAFLTP